MRRMRELGDFDGENLQSFLMNYNLESNLFDRKNFNWQSFFPSQKVNVFKESWLKKAIDDLPHADGVRKEIMLKIVEMAAKHYYNLLEVLLRVYPPNIQRHELIEKGIEKNQGFPFLKEDSDSFFQLWESGEERSSSYDLNGNISMLLANTSLTKADNSIFHGTRIEDFFTQFSADSMLISNSDMQKIIQRWNEETQHHWKTWFTETKRKEYIDFLEKDYLIEQLKIEDNQVFSESYWPEGRTLEKGRAEEFLHALTCNDIEEYNTALKTLDLIWGDTGDWIYSATLGARLNDENDEIRMSTWERVLYEMEWIPGQTIMDFFAEKMLRFGNEQNKFPLLFGVSPFGGSGGIDYIIRNTIPAKLDSHIMRDLSIHSDNFSHTYTDPILQHHFFPFKNHLYEDGERFSKDKSEKNIFIALELKEKYNNEILPKWNNIILLKLRHIFENGTEEEQCDATSSLKRINTPEAVEVVKRIQETGSSHLKYLLELPNEHGYTMSSIYNEFTKLPNIDRILKEHSNDH
jgi:hypothetical protein